MFYHFRLFQFQCCCGIHITRYLYLLVSNPFKNFESFSHCFPRKLSRKQRNTPLNPNIRFFHHGYGLVEGRKVLQSRFLVLFPKAFVIIFQGGNIKHIYDFSKSLLYFLLYGLVSSSSFFLTSGWAFITLKTSAYHFLPFSFFTSYSFKV